MMITIKHIITRNISLIFLQLFSFIIIFFSVILGANFPIFFLNENQILYLFSTSAQVVAGIFGLIITGYIFLRNELEREMESDETIVDAVNELKRKYFYMIIFLSIYGSLAIVFSLLSISSENYNNQFIKTVVFNLSVSFIMTEIISIFYFAIDMINPNRIESISNRIKNELITNKNAPKGGLSDFMEYFNKIENLLTKYNEEKISLFNEINRQNQNLKYKSRSIPKSKIVYELVRNEKIDKSKAEELIDLIKYRNSLIHGSDFSVDQEMIEKARQLYDLLEDILSVK